MTDFDSFRRYRKHPSEDAFAALVRHYVDAVYSAAARQLSSSPDLAQDVTQTVFLELAHLYHVR